MENSKSVFTALVALFIGAALLGSSAIFVRFSETSPSLTAFYRALLALPFLYVWVLRTKSDLPLGTYLSKKNLLTFFQRPLVTGISPLKMSLQRLDVPCLQIKVIG